jgi:hypothetical protein
VAAASTTIMSAASDGHSSEELRSPCSPVTGVEDGCSDQRALELGLAENLLHGQYSSLPLRMAAGIRDNEHEAVSERNIINGSTITALRFPLLPSWTIQSAFEGIFKSWPFPPLWSSEAEIRSCSLKTGDKAQQFSLLNFVSCGTWKTESVVEIRS